MKKIKVLYFTLLICFSCKINNSYIGLSQVSVLPDENYYPKGDSTYESYLNRGDKIVPNLIAVLNDTTYTKVVYGDVIHYRVGDIALNLIDDNYNVSELPLQQIIETEFFKNEKVDYPFFIDMYHDLFHFNSSKVNFENRLRLQKVILEWFKELD